MIKKRLSGWLLFVLPLLGSFFCPLPRVVAADPAGFDHHLSIQLFPKENRLVGSDRITLKWDAPPKGETEPIFFLLHAGFKVKAIRAGEYLVPFSTEPNEANSDLQWLQMTPPPPVAGLESIFEISYEGIMKDSGDEQAVGFEPIRAVISEAGAILPDEAGWYPTVAEGPLSTFTLTAATPPEWEVVSHDRLISRQIEETERRTVWRSDHPTPGLTLVAGPYRLSTRKVDQVVLSAYFSPEESASAEGYLNSASEYLRFYQNILGPYPFAFFSLVGTSVAGGEGFPSAAVLEKESIRRGDSQETKIARAVAHTWFGGDLFPKEEEEEALGGLETYLAEFLYREGSAGADAARLRRQIVISQNPARAGEPTTEVAAKENAVEYPRSAFLFHMLRNDLGDSLFNKGLRHFVRKEGGKRVGWKEIQGDFSQATGKDLTWFFHQWTDRAGAPSLHLTEARKWKEGKTYRVRLALAQEGPLYRLRVPFRIEFNKGSERKWVETASSTMLIDWHFQQEPLAIEIDPDYDLLRQIGSAGSELRRPLKEETP